MRLPVANRRGISRADLHAELFAEAARVGDAIQLCYYRGLNEFVASQWATTPNQLRDQMVLRLVSRRTTQLRRLLEPRARRSRADTPFERWCSSVTVSKRTRRTMLRFVGQLAIRTVPGSFLGKDRPHRYACVQVDRACDQRRARAVRCVEP